MATVGELALLVGGDVDGDASLEITGVSEIHDGRPGTVTFLEGPRFAQHLTTTSASAIVAAHGEPKVPKTLIRVDHPARAFSKILSRFAEAFPVSPGIHPTAIVAPTARISPKASIGALTVVEGEAAVEEGAIVGPLCHLGRGAAVGEGTELKSRVVIYPRSIVGKRCLVHAGAVIGSDGFGFLTEEDVHHKVPQTGRAVVGDDVEIGANTTIDRGTIGDTTIGDGTKVDNLVQIAHNVKIGRGCLIAAQTAIAGSTVVGDFSVFAGQSGAVDHVVLGPRTTLAAKSAAAKSLPGGKIYSGFPAREVGEKNRLDALVARLPELLERLRKVEAELARLKETK